VHSPTPIQLGVAAVAHAGAPSSLGHLKAQAAVWLSCFFVFQQASHSVAPTKLVHNATKDLVKAGGQ